MRAMVLAAGRGSRLRPLTDTTPKPLLQVADGVRLCDWTLAGLKRAGITDIVMNTAHLPETFEALPQELAARGLHLELSREARTHDQSLESLGGIVRALPLLTDEGRDMSPVVIVAGDVVHNYDFSRLFARAREIEAGDYDVFLVAVPNPNFNSQDRLCRWQRFAWRTAARTQLRLHHGGQSQDLRWVEARVVQTFPLDVGLCRQGAYARRSL